MELSAVATGDRAAFEVLFRTHYRALCAFAMGYVKDRDRAEDLVQDLFFRLWRDHRAVVLNDPPKSYFYTAVRNRCLSEMKTAGRMRVLREEVDDNVEEAGPTEEEHSERIARVQAAIAALPQERQRIFRMAKLEGRKYQEIAELLGISVKTVENQMGSALRTLRTELGDLLPLLAWLAFLLEAGDRGIG